ncbi:MAG: ABC transporter substrate-binding protein, partial [Burkholderiales bacterium]
LNAKRLDLLKEVMPQITQAAVILNPNNPLVATNIKETEIVAKAIKVGLRRFEVRGPDDFEAAISSVARARINAAVVFEDPVLIANVTRFAVLATKQRLAAAGNREFAEAGGLIGYGVNFPAIFRRAAYFVDKSLKGARPGDIPVEQATRFELIVNQKTARTLGIKIPPSILVRADRVIE